MVENQKGKNMKFLMSDNRGEYASTEFKVFLTVKASNTS